MDREMTHNAVTFQNDFHPACSKETETVFIQISTLVD